MGQPIGVFDSGVGGLSVLGALREALPGEDFLYYADRAHCPYGSLSAQAICQRAVAITDELIQADCKMIVVACNTATIAAIAHLRARFDLPFVGMEPAVKPACAATRSGVIGVMATEAAIGGDKFRQLVAEHAANVQVVIQACAGLVECIESGDFESEQLKTLVQRYLAPMQQAKADVVVLGCTHYPFLRPLIEQTAGPGVTVLDAGAAVARQARRVLERSSALAPTESGGTIDWRGSAGIDLLDDWLKRLPRPKSS